MVLWLLLESENWLILKGFGQCDKNCGRRFIFPSQRYDNTVEWEYVHSFDQLLSSQVKFTVNGNFRNSHNIVVKLLSSILFNVTLASDSNEKIKHSCVDLEILPHATEIQSKILLNESFLVYFLHKQN